MNYTALHFIATLLAASIMIATLVTVVAIIAWWWRNRDARANAISKANRRIR